MACERVVFGMDVLMGRVVVCGYRGGKRMMRLSRRDFGRIQKEGEKVEERFWDDYDNTWSGTRGGDGFTVHRNPSAGEMEASRSSRVLKSPP
jgi:hypothetical protein